MNPLNSEVLDEFRSTDLDIADLFDRFDLPIDVYDKTDEWRYIGSIIEEKPVLRFVQQDSGTLLRTEKP
jgi:hypothetical protein